MTLGVIMHGDPFFMSIDGTWLDGHVDENNSFIMAKHSSEALALAVRDAQEHKAHSVVYACIPIGTVNTKGKVTDWAGTDIERMARAAIALGVDNGEATGRANTGRKNQRSAGRKLVNKRNR